MNAVIMASSVLLLSAHSTAYRGTYRCEIETWYLEEPTINAAGRYRRPEAEASRVVKVSDGD